MLRIRLVCVAAATLSIASVAAGGGAKAQSASADTSTPPSFLTQLFGQTTTAPAPASATPAPIGTAAPPVRTTRSRRVASRRHRTAEYTKQATNQRGDPPADTAQSNASADAWLSASTPPRNATANATPANSAPVSAPEAVDAAQQDTALPASAALPSAVVVDGQTVQIAESDQVNEIDLAATSAPANTSTGGAPASDALAANAPGDVAGRPTMHSSMETTLPRGDRADMIGAAAVKAAQADVAQNAFAAAPAAPIGSGGTIAESNPPESVAQNSGAQSIDDQNAAAQNSSTHDSSSQDSGMLGGVAWIAQLLAAMGGAVTASIVAWVLIGADTVRNYG